MYAVGDGGRPYDDLEALLREWQSRAALALFAYNRAANRARRLHVTLGGTVAALTAAIGTSVFATLEQDVGTAARIVVGLVSVSAAVLAGVQAFASLPARIDDYERAARRYGDLRRRIELTRARAQVDESTLEELRRALSDAAENSPNAPPSIWNRTRREMRGEFAWWHRVRARLAGRPAPSRLGSGEPPPDATR